MKKVFIIMGHLDYVCAYVISVYSSKIGAEKRLKVIQQDNEKYNKALGEGTAHLQKYKTKFQGLDYYYIIEKEIEK